MNIEIRLKNSIIEKKKKMLKNEPFVILMKEMALFQLQLSLVNKNDLIADNKNDIFKFNGISIDMREDIDSDFEVVTLSEYIAKENQVLRKKVGILFGDLVRLV